jgi:hypothetical protein
VLASNDTTSSMMLLKLLPAEIFLSTWVLHTADQLFIAIPIKDGFDETLMILHQDLKLIIVA